MIRLLALVLLLAAGSANATDQYTAEEQAVLAAMQQWEIAVEAGDFETLSGLYTDDAIYYPHHMAPLLGRDRIMEQNRSRGTGAKVEITQAVDNVEVNGSWAVYSCLARVVVSGADGAAPAVREVRVLLLMEQGADGQWRIHRDIDNQPPA